MNKMRVLLLVNRWYPDGGVENFLEQLVAETSDLVDYSIASLITPVESNVCCEKIGPVLLSGRIWDMYVHSGLIRKAMCRDFDVVHIQASNGSAFFLAALAQSAGIPKRIIHSHNAGAETSSSLPKSFVGRASRVVWAGAPTDLWACSENAGEYLFGDRAFRVFCNGIDIERFTFSGEERTRVRRMLGVADDEFLLGSIGRISLQKNPLFQLRVFAELKKLLPTARFCMVGSGDMEPERNAEVERLGLGDSYIGVGRTSESDAFYSAFDALLLPPVFEGLTFVAIEAQSEGLAVYGSEALPRELAATELISFNSLKEEPAAWARRIADGIGWPSLEERPMYAEKMRFAGFAKEGCFAAIARSYEELLSS